MFFRDLDNSKLFLQRETNKRSTVQGFHRVDQINNDMNTKICRLVGKGLIDGLGLGSERHVMYM